MKQSLRIRILLFPGLFVQNVLAGPIVLPSLSNADFETNAALFSAWPGYTGGSNPAQITNWPGTGNRGINPGAIGSAPFRDNGHNTSNVAFLQGSSSISNLISGWVPGRPYRIAFDYNARAIMNDPGMRAVIGKVTVNDSLVPPTGGMNAYYTANLLFTPTNTSASLRFEQTVGGDRTLLIDNLRIFRTGPDIADNGFERPVQPINSWEQANGTGAGDLGGSAWTITGAAGITRNISPFQNGGRRAPEGEQHALLQQVGAFVQTVCGFEIGSAYTLSLLTMARQGQGFGNDLQVLLDVGLPSEIPLIDITEVTNSRFTEVESGTFVALKDSYTLTIRASLNGGNLTGDRTTFFDNVWFNQQTEAPLSLSKTVNANTTDTGSNLTYTIQVFNTFTGAIGGIVVTDTLPAEVEFVASTPPADQTNANQYRFSLGTLGPGSNAVITIDATVTASVPSSVVITNRASASTTNQNISPSKTFDSAKTLLFVPTDILALSKSVLQFQTNLTYILRVTNRTTNTAMNLTVVDTLPPSLVFVNGIPQPDAVVGNTYTFNLGPLPGLSSTDIVFAAVYPSSAPLTITNSAAVETTSFEDVLTNNTAEVATFVGSRLDLVLNKTVSSTQLLPGESNLTYTITVTNAGATSATDVVVTDTIPPGVGFITNQPAASQTNFNDYSFNLGTLIPGAGT
ncbi:MAG: hypothetical protein AAF492_00810, partial [Verrucomicrobiota bacterium]